jgi:Pumilio-family RNA binding repeat
MDCTDLSIGAGMSIENVGFRNSITRRIVLMFCQVNRFAGTRLEDLAGEISSLCKDQHGCRYLQKKLEEGVPEHRDMIFRETFGHFADLMTGKQFYYCPTNFL